MNLSVLNNLTDKENKVVDYLYLDDLQQVLFGSLENGIDFIMVDISSSSITIVVNSRWSVQHGHTLLKNRLRRQRATEKCDGDLKPFRKTLNHKLNAHSK